MPKVYNVITVFSSFIKGIFVYIPGHARNFTQAWGPCHPQYNRADGLLKLVLWHPSFFTKGLAAFLPWSSGGFGGILCFWWLLRFDPHFDSFSLWGASCTLTSSRTICIWYYSPTIIKFVVWDWVTNFYRWVKTGDLYHCIVANVCRQQE